MVDYKTTDTKEEILKKLNNDGANTGVANAGRCYLQNKLQEELLESQKIWQEKLLENQNFYNEDQLFWTRILAIATWALVIVTALLIKF